MPDGLHIVDEIPKPLHLFIEYNLAVFIFEEFVDDLTRFDMYIV
jgi:hypothetical protein